MKVLRLLGFWERILWSLGKSPDWTRSDRAIRGRYGEWLGRRTLRRKGYRQMSRNWRSKSDGRQEIDLICSKSDLLVFVEIRARSRNSLVGGYHSVNGRKRRALKRSFRSYLVESRSQASNFRFDVVEIDLPRSVGEEPVVFHHENIAIF